MSDKKDKTREHILQVSYPLFAEKGFKQITMKDICQISGMSRGGYTAIFPVQHKYLRQYLNKLQVPLPLISSLK